MTEEVAESRMKCVKKNLKVRSDEVRQGCNSPYTASFWILLCIKVTALADDRFLFVRCGLSTDAGSAYRAKTEFVGFQDSKNCSQDPDEELLQFNTA